MADDLGVMDAPEVEAGTEEIESGVETAIEGAEETEGAEKSAGESKSDDPYSTKFSREMRAALKSWEQANPEAAKFARQARDNHARLFSLTQIEPKGIDGVREKYALLDGLSRGEFKGAEALTAIQEELAGVEEVDELLASGDPRAFDALGEDFNEGLAKLAPAYLERIQRTDPDGYEKAILPHAVDLIGRSEVMQQYNLGIDELTWIINGRALGQLSPEELARFANKALSVLINTSSGLNQMQKNAGTINSVPDAGKKSSIEEERSQIEQERQNIHWDTRIKPDVTSHENKKFDELFSPYQKRLRLDAGARADLMQAFKAGMHRAGTADADYQRQMKIYRGQRNPDPAVVSNFVKNAINKHSKSVMESLIKARYSPFLAGKPKAAPVVPITNNGTKPKGPAAPNVEIRTVKPPSSEIDFKNTPVEWLREKKYRLNSGKIIQIRVQ